MDETAAAAAASPSSALPDYAIFGDIDNLSPVTAVKASDGLTGFPGFSSPIVFTSPDLNPSGGSYSKRLQCHPPSSKEIYQHDSRGKKIECYSEDIGKNKDESSSSLIHCRQREFDYGSREDLFSSPSGCVDKYLVDAVEVDYEKNKHSASYDLIQLNQCSNSKANFASKDNVRQAAEESIFTFSDNLQLQEHVFQENSSFDEKPVEKDASNQGNELHSISKNPVSEHRDISEGVPEFPSQPKNSSFGYEHGSDSTREASRENYENEGQCSRGLQRRRLHFEEADCHVIESALTLWNPSTAEIRRSYASPVDLEVREPPVSERTDTSNQPVSTISRLTVSKPSGIGLHLNSIVNSKPNCVSTGISITSDDKGSLDVQGQLISCLGYPHENINNGSISLKIRRRVSTIGQNEEASDSPCPEFGSSNDPALSMQRDYPETPRGKRKFTLDQACDFEMLNQSSSKKKSRKALANSDGDGCKRCNCKKTKCLKLYCDCFAAGIYCSESCSCQGCFNRPDYVDTVLEVRQQIESRNPHAFAPKVVERLIDSYVVNNMKAGTDSTPPSARHKRGCNCKKSMCMKKYCECYQNNVGCSSGCRCEGCQNVYGKKEDYHLAKDASLVPISETSDENVELLSYQDCFLQNEPSDHYSITSMTPSFQLSNHENEGSKSKLSARRFFSSPEPDNGLMPNCGGSLGTTDNYGMLVKSRKEGVVSSHPELDFGDSDTVDASSPTYDGLAVVGNSSRLSNSRDQFSFESGDLSSATSLDRCKSPFTTPGGPFGKAKLFKADFEEKLGDILEDDTPEILKDPINAVKASSPNKKRVSPPHIKTVKVSSPNKKRLSPPRIHSLRRLSSFSSSGLRNGRKFILRSLPSFPPLTPCNDGKDSNNQSKRS